MESAKNCLAKDPLGEHHNDGVASTTGSRLKIDSHKKEHYRQVDNGPPLISVLFQLNSWSLPFYFFGGFTLVLWLPAWALLVLVQGVFSLTGTPLKSSKYKKVNLG